MKITILIIAMALVTYLPRALPGALIEKMHFSYKFEKFLSLIPYTAMTALIFPGVLTVDKNLWYIGTIGTLVALVLSWKKCSMIVVVIAAVLADILLYSIL